MANKFAVISNDYVVNGFGSSFSPFNYSQLVNLLSGGSIVSDVFHLSGTRVLTEDSFITLSATSSIIISAFGEEPWVICTDQDFYFKISAPSVTIYDGKIQAATTDSTVALFDGVNQQSITIDNCYIRIDNLQCAFSFDDLNAVNIRNCIVVADRFTGSNLRSCNVVNTIFDVDDIIVLAADDVDSLTVDSCAFTSALTDFTTPSTDWTEIQESWARPSIFDNDVSALSASDLNYLNSAFETVTVIGNTVYTNTWYNGTRDGIGSLYFPTISGVAVSASTTSAAPSSDITFTLSGNDPFTVFSASSATYDFDGTTQPSINTNLLITHAYSSANNYYNVTNNIQSKNGWYTVAATPQVILIGGFTVTITLFDAFGNNKTDGVLRPLSHVVTSATVTGYAGVMNYEWDFGDSTGGNPVSGDTNPDSVYYVGLGVKSIILTAYATEETFSATDTATLGISALTSAYYVNITSAYDSSTVHAGSLTNPFTWNEFKTRVESFVSADYGDSYFLSGARKLTKPSSGQSVLALQPLKNLTIDTWQARNRTPWVWEIEDWSITDTNSILSAVGSTLKNGIIYNKAFSYPYYGGTLKITNVYDMFIVYQGTYAGIEINPFNNVLYCGGSCAVVMASADSNIVGSTIYLSGDGYTDDFVVEDYADVYAPAVVQSDYNLHITDSVMTNFDKETTAYFDEAVLRLNNSTFNRAESAMEADYTISSNDDNQYDWIPPADYPFTPDNRLYDRELEYIITKRGDLRPFDDIAMPPNPGYGASAYDGYETGLFGYYRKEYSTSGA